MAKGREIVRTDESLSLGKFMTAPVSDAVRANGFIFVSGYVPLNPKTGKAEPGSIGIQTRRTLQNIKTVLEQAGSSLDKVVKVNIFISDLNDYQGMNKVYREFFKKDFPARRTVHALLVGGFKVEMDCIALE